MRNFRNCTEMMQKPGGNFDYLNKIREYFMEILRVFKRKFCKIFDDFG